MTTLVQSTIIIYQPPYCQIYISSDYLDISQNQILPQIVINKLKTSNSDKCISLLSLSKSIPKYFLEE